MKALSLGTLVVLVCGMLLTPVPALAQDKFWGIAADVTPKWKSLALFEPVYDLQEMDISGGDFRIGFVRGRTLGSEWGVSFVRRGVEEGGRIANNTQAFTLRDDVGMTGVEVNKFASFGTIRDRVQIGMIIGVGVASLSGTARTAAGEIVDVQDVLALFGNDSVGIQPLGRLELAGTAIVTAGFKIRVSGGLDWPGTTKFTIGGVYFFGER